MAGKFISMRNLKFLLYEVFDTASLAKAPYYSLHNRKSMDLVLDASMKLAKKMLFPVFEEMDRNTPYLDNGEVKVHPAVPDIMREFGEGGWIGATFPESWYGEQLPYILHCACQLIKASANYSAGVYPELTTGAARLIGSFAGDDLKQAYLPDMLAVR